MVDVVYKDECYQIIGAAMEVHKELGSGLLEAVYQEALELEFKERGIPYEREKKLVVNYKGHQLEKYYIADFVCYGKIILELKAVEALLPVHTSQVLNYLNIADMKLGIIMNFSSNSLSYKRVVNTNK